jgi:phosphatidate cytidylyltransferase
VIVFEHPVTLWITVGVVALLAAAPLVMSFLSRRGVVAAPLRAELWKRYFSWLVLAPLIVGPILLGTAWTIVAVALLSLLCYREYARATGLFREKTVSLVVVLGILALTFAELDHWYGFFIALFPLVSGLIAVTAILGDRPQGYIQRVALGVFAFMLFGCALGHLGFMANDRHYRPLVLMVVLAVEMNDVFAFMVGKKIGGRKLAPRTSPNKTISGSVGALVLTTALVFCLGRHVFEGTPLDSTARLLLLGAIIAAVGQLGDLMLSSVKRDLGIKDMAATLPGHGGWLDRFNSLLLVAPAVFHYVNYFVGIGTDQPTRIISAG